MGNTVTLRRHKWKHTVHAHFWRCFSPFWQNSRVVAHPPTEKPLEDSVAYLNEGRKVRIVAPANQQLLSRVSRAFAPGPSSRDLIPTRESRPHRCTTYVRMNATLLIAVRDYSSTVCDIQKIAGILTERTAAVSSLEHSK